MISVAQIGQFMEERETLTTAWSSRLHETAPDFHLLARLLEKSPTSYSAQIHRLSKSIIMSLLGLELVAGAGFEPATFGL